MIKLSCRRDQESLVTLARRRGRAAEVSSYHCCLPVSHVCLEVQLSGLINYSLINLLGFVDVGYQGWSLIQVKLVLSRSVG